MEPSSGQGQEHHGRDPWPGAAPTRAMVDPELEALLDAARAAELPRISSLEPDAARERLRASRRSLPPGPPVAEVVDLVIPVAHGGVPARVYRPEAQEAPGTVVYFHGGGWVVGGLAESDALCRLLAVTSRCEVISVDYRLAPEHPFPAALEDAKAAVAFSAASRPNRPLVVMGDSAGGNLAAVAARHARDAGGPEIVLQVLVYPVAQPPQDGGSYVEHGGQYLICAEDMRWFWEQYVPSPAARRSPDASPLLADSLTGLPPALVVVAEYDPLRDEGLAYGQRLVDEGVPVRVDRYDTMVHGFFAMVGVLSTADAAVESVGAVIAAAISTPAP